MKNPIKILYIVLIIAFVFYALMGVIFGISSATHPVEYEIVSVVLFALATVALWTDRTHRKPCPSWLRSASVVAVALLISHVFLMVGAILMQRK